MELEVKILICLIQPLPLLDYEHPIPFTRGHENDGTSVADMVLSLLLVEMDGLDQRIGVTVIAATNRPDKIDPALLRPGRFDRLLDVQPPNEADRADIFRIHTRSMPCSPDMDLNELAILTEQKATQAQT